ncbi:MAG: LTA synthase family protein [Oscillospiraceae bacterium]
MEVENRSIWTLTAIPAVIIYLELITKLFCFGTLNYRGVLFTVLFSLAAGIMLTFICSFIPQKGFFPALFAVSGLLSIIFALQNVYYNVFGTFFTFYSVTEAGGVLSNFWREALEGVRRSVFQLIAVFSPLAVLYIFRKKLLPVTLKRTRFGLLASSILLYIAAVAAILSANSGVMSPRYLYTGSFMPELSVRYFGILTTTRLDLEQLMPYPSEVLPINSDVPEQTPTPTPVQTPQATPAETPAAVNPNVLDIDFDTLIANEDDPALKKIHEYFSSVEPTFQNEYTGRFQGKNLIWIVAEGFSDLALDETHTPTLYKLAHSGFVFNNFYNPIWGVSTSDGEYITLTGQLPKSGVWSFTESADNDMRMTFGRMLGALGYDCRAYHDHTYTYYNRNLSHPNMGYIYEGVGNGLELEKVWPASDLEMIQKTVDDYIGSDKFHTYYMTVSGHMYYTFTGNTQAYRHKDDVADLPYSEDCRAYIACNMEFDLAVQELISRLDEAGKLEDTVIVISGDHYPYGLTNAEIEEIRGGPVDNFELYHSTLIIWSGDMDKPIEINKLCYSADIMPTLANLFGLDYDSRLLSGRDILSDTPGFVIFANRSFISDYGRYDSTKDTFYPNTGVSVPENYARDTLYGRVSDTFDAAAAILDYDYYAIVMPPDDTDNHLEN